MEYAETHIPAAAPPPGTAAAPGDQSLSQPPTLPPAPVQPSTAIVAQPVENAPRQEDPATVAMKPPVAPPASLSPNAIASSSSQPIPRYGPNIVPNPAAALPPDQVVGEKALLRPAFIPADMDPRIVPESIHMMVGETPTGPNVLYVVPGPCDRCTSQRQICTRKRPMCALCAKNGDTCVLGTPYVVNLPPTQASSEVDDEGGRGKRVKKQRRLSASDEVDPNLLSFDGTTLKQPRSRPSRPNPLPRPHDLPARPEDVDPSSSDRDYEQRAMENSEKPGLGQTRGPCPIFANRRQALTAACSWMRNPVETNGALVDIGTSGIARGVVLQGRPWTKSFWGEREDAGTIVTTIGPKRMRMRDSADVDSAKPAQTIAERFLGANTVSDNETVDPERNVSSIVAMRNGKEVPGPRESEPVEALLMAQRAQTPVAVAVSEAYQDVPFKVPRPYIVLGWFWIIDAWVAPMPGEGEVAWMFQFEWCGEQDLPWWSNIKDPASNGTEYIDGPALPFPVRGPGVSGSTTYRGRPRPVAPEGDSEEDKVAQELAQYIEAGILKCGTCKKYSDTVYENHAPCLNERCPDFFLDVRPELAGDDKARVCEPGACPGRVRKAVRCLPSRKSWSLLPPDPPVSFSEVQRHDAHRDLWRGWVCRRCRCANERRDWFGFMCEACDLVDRPKRKTYSSEALAPPTRLKCTGPRPDDGFPTWNESVQTRTVTLPDDLKVVQQVLSPASAVWHLLSTHAHGLNTAADEALLSLQAQGSEEVPFRRQFLNATSSIPSELALSPFYTFISGPQPAPFLAHFPTGQPRAWKDSPQVCRTVADIINERAGRVSPGQPELNSLLITAMPASLWKLGLATIPVPPSSSLALLILGSDCSLVFKEEKSRSRCGELSAQHGDVIVVRTDKPGLDIDIRMDGFGFIGIARQVYAPATGAVAEVNGPPVEPTTARKPARWYVGVLPLDKTQPLRVHPTLRPDSFDTFETADETVPPTEPERFAAPQNPWRGTELVPEFTTSVIKVPTEKPRRDDSDDEDDEPKPKRSRARSGTGGSTRGTPRGGARGRGGRVASGSTRATPKPRTKRPGPSGTGSASVSVAATPAAEGPEEMVVEPVPAPAEGPVGPTENMENVDNVEQVDAKEIL